MAIIEARTPLALESGQPSRASGMGVFARPTSAQGGWKSWLTSVDHKKIGIMYGAGALFFLLVGGVEALLIRTQLAQPGNKVLSAAVYNQVYTMHGVTMVFFFVMPMAAAFINYLLPLQIGARDVAFPRMNAFSFWCWLGGALLFNSSWFLGGGADGGWFAYPPNTSIIYSPGYGMDFYIFGLAISGIASLVSSINLIVTVINMRAPGMTWFKLPVFTWMSLVTQFLLAFALPVITVALFLLAFDRNFGSNFFDVAHGGDPLLWQHLFWIFGHPEVYIIILPSFGIVSEVIPVFSRKPIFGYPFMVFSGIAIGFMGWGVWAHHMFASGMGPMSTMAFSLATMFIAVPTGVKILNWVATLYGGRLRFTSAMLWALGTVTMFTIGGLSGITHSVAPVDYQHTDTYHIVGHFHYVIFGGGFLGLMAGTYFWYPKIFGHFLREGLGKLHFAFTLAGLNLTFGAMHILGLQGMSRRYFTYSENQGFGFWNMVATIGAYSMAFGTLIFLWNIYTSWRRHKANPVDVGPDPWDGRSLEWMVPSPTPEYNFAEVPTVTEYDEFWHRKYGHDEDHRAVRIAATEDVTEKPGATGIHLPSPSYWPLVLAAGLPIFCYGLMFHKQRYSGPGTDKPIEFTGWAIGLGLVGIVIMVVAIFGWVMEPSTDPDDGHHDHGHGDGAHGDGGHSDESHEAHGEIESPDQAVGAGAIVGGGSVDAPEGEEPR